MPKEKRVMIFSSWGTFNGSVSFGRYPYIKGGEDCTWVSEQDSDYTIRGNWSEKNICQGVITYPKGRDRLKYDGRSKDGIPSGYGTMYYANGDIYKGEWEYSYGTGGDGKPSGEGTYTFADGKVLKGKWGDGPNGLTVKNDINPKEKGSKYIGEVSGGVPNGIGRFTSPSGRMYHGQWKNGKKNGQGKAILNAGVILEGIWKDDYYQSGPGRIVYPDGCIYEGEISTNTKTNNLERIGKGKLIHPNGTIQEGIWKDNRLYGQGKETHANGTIYEGYFNNSVFQSGDCHIVYSDGVYDGEMSISTNGKLNRNGRGKLTYSNGTIREGNWKDNYLNGYGKLIFPDGTIQEGNWKDGKLDGQGKEINSNGSIIDGIYGNGIFQSGIGHLIFPSGAVYDGELTKDIDSGFHFNGKGKYFVPDQYTYEGEFLNTQFHGMGRLTMAFGDIYDCEWKEGKKDGPGKIITKDGATVEGVWKDDVLDGELVRLYDETGKLTYEGNYYDGKRNGIGKSWLAGGEYYEGEFRDDKMHGKGRLRLEDGNVLTGEFKDGRINFENVRFELENGCVFEGKCENGQMNGKIHFTLSDGGVVDGELVNGEIAENSTLTREGEAQKAKWHDGRWVFETEKSFIVIHFDNMTPIVEELTKEMQDFKAEAAEAIETEGKYLTVSAVDNSSYSKELRPFFDELVGMDSVKSQIDKIYKRFKIDAMRQQMLGINAQKQGYYFIMSGNPGTGKTTVARIIAKMLYQVGLLPSDSYVEVDRSALVSQYIGETEKKTVDAINAARGGTLFIDEAYTLYKKDSSNDPGAQAIDVLLKDMEDHRGEYCVIMAGYKKQMSDMVRNANPGLASRFDHHIEIPDYSAEELLQILVKMASDRHFYIESDARNRILDQIEREKIDDTFDNARFSRRMFEAVLEKQAERLTENIDDLKPEDLQVLKAEDFVPLKAAAAKDYLKELDELIGLPGVKEEVRHLVNSARILIESRNRGLDTADDVIPLNLVFTGNPGTGKTTVARILAKVYTQLGLLRRDDIFVECTRGDLVGEYQGHTAARVREKVREALGGVLFIDEAYSLRIDEHDSFGLEAVNALITEIENNREKLAVIFAGYTKEMEDFLATNPGLKSRMARTIEFTDYSDEELTKIFFFNMKKRGYTVLADEDFVTDYIAARSHTKDFGNARGVRNLCDDVLRNMKARLIATDDLSALTNEQLTEILPEDFR